jgi:protease-4
MNRKFLEAVLKGQWFIDPGFILNNADLIANVISGKMEFSQDKFDLSALSQAGAGVVFSSRQLDSAPKGSISIIPVIGSLFKEDQDCGPIGMATMGNMLKKADGHPNISAHLLYIDSPGGTVDGLETFGNIVKAAKKPVIAFVDGMMASAALWIGSCAKEAYASTEIDQIGSVGVLLSFMDVQPVYEKLGAKFHKITADQSYDKTRIWDDLRAGKYQEYKNEVLNPLAQRFMDVVKANRPGVKDEQLHGKVYFAKDVIGSFIDGIKNIDQAVARAQELGQEYDRSQESSQTQISNTQMKQFPHVNKVLGVESLESADGSASLNEQQLEAIESAIEQGATSQLQLASANEAKQKAEGDLAAANSTIEAQKAEINSLKSAAAGGGAQAITDKEVLDKKSEGFQSVVKEDADFLTNLDAVAKKAKEFGY